jgi:hypothetical protein
MSSFGFTLMRPYQPEQWRLSQDYTHSQEEFLFAQQRAHQNPNARDQSRLLELLGLINYQILTGNRVYIAVDGVVYKTLFGAYWRSVFTGIEHYLLKCEKIPLSMWAEGGGVIPVVDLPIVYSDGGWTAGGYSLSLMIFRA